jgi:hypothetical protein
MKEGSWSMKIICQTSSNSMDVLSACTTCGIISTHFSTIKRHTSRTDLKLKTPIWRNWHGCDGHEFVTLWVLSFFTWKINPNRMYGHFSIKIGISTETSKTILLHICYVHPTSIHTEAIRLRERCSAEGRK